VRGWVFRVAHNLVVDTWRTAPGDHFVQDESAAASAPDAGLNPEEIVLRKEKVRRVREAVRSLSPHQRQCLALRAEGFRYREIAEIVGVGKSAVAECLQRCIDLLIRHGNG
jgi:RNA polymerase sigma-70 factor (ECF subfamily)